jgi:hypothetical protein
VRFAMLREDLRNLAAGLLHDELIGIDEFKPQPRGKEASDRRLPQCP